MKARLCGLLIAATATAHAGLLFQDSFGTPGTQLDLANWTTEIGSSSYLGRTQLTNWVSGSGQFVVGASGAQLALNTFNPTGVPLGTSLLGTHGKTLMTFQPTLNSTIEFTARLLLNSIQPGIVFGVYLYGCPGPCATLHDEIDIELVTNALQPGTLQVQLNRYANEPLGAGHGGLINLPMGFNPLAVHDWTIRWSTTRIDYLVDGILLSTSFDHVPQGPMQVNVIAWGPDSAWAAAHNSSLVSVASAGANQSFVALLQQVTVTDSVPEPATWLLTALGLAAVGLRGMRARIRR